MEEFAAVIGIDWADRKHVARLRAKGGKKIERVDFASKSESVDEWARGLRKRFEGEKIAVLLEQSKGSLIFSLMKYDFIVLFPVHPATLAKYRETWSPSGAKDDPTDAEFLLEMGVKHPERLKAWNPDRLETRELQRLTEFRRKLMDDRKRFGNRLTSLLKDYFPQVLELFPDIGRNIVADFLLGFPTLEAAQAASDEELFGFFRKHNSGSLKKSTERVLLIRNAVVLTTDEAIVAPSALLARALAEQIRTCNSALQAFDEKILEVYQTHPDKKIIDSLPGAGDVTAPRLIAALGSDRSRFESADEISRFTGIAPLLERSGNHSWTHWRFLCNKTLRQAIVEWTGISIKHSFWAKAYYRKQRLDGKKHHVAVRALAYKWIRIIFRLWKDGKTYNEATYLEALRKSGSPLLKHISASV